MRKRWQKYKLREDKIELNRLTNLIHDEIRNFRASNFEKEVQKEYERNTVWNVAGRLKGSRNITNVPIHGRDGLHYQPEGKTTAIAECLEDQFQANDTEDDFRDHYKLVRREVHRFRNTEFEASVPLVTSNEVRKIIKNLRPKKAPGHDGVTNSMIKQLPLPLRHLHKGFISFPILYKWPFRPRCPVSRPITTDSCCMLMFSSLVEWILEI